MRAGNLISQIRHRVCTQNEKKKKSIKNITAAPDIYTYRCITFYGSAEYCTSNEKSIRGPKLRLESSGFVAFVLFYWPALGKIRIRKVHILLSKDFNIRGNE